MDEIQRSLVALKEKSLSYSKESDKNKKDELRKGMLEISLTIRKLVREQVESLKNV